MEGQARDELEQRVAAALARMTGRPAWDVFAALDAICESVAADGPSRLHRSQV